MNDISDEVAGILKKGLYHRLFPKEYYITSDGYRHKPGHASYVQGHLALNALSGFVTRAIRSTRLRLHATQGKPGGATPL